MENQSQTRADLPVAKHTHRLAKGRASATRASGEGELPPRKRSSRFSLTTGPCCITGVSLLGQARSPSLVPGHVPSPCFIFPFQALALVPESGKWGFLNAQDMFPVPSYGILVWLLEPQQKRNKPPGAREKSLLTSGVLTTGLPQPVNTTGAGQGPVTRETANQGHLLPPGSTAPLMLHTSPELTAESLLCQLSPVLVSPPDTPWSCSAGDILSGMGATALSQLPPGCSGQ